MIDTSMLSLYDRPYEECFSCSTCRGRFLTFITPKAQAITHALYKDHHVLVDCRESSLRISFTIYHEEADVQALADIIRQLRV